MALSLHFRERNKRTIPNAKDEKNKPLLGPAYDLRIMSFGD